MTLKEKTVAAIRYRVSATEQVAIVEVSPGSFEGQHQRLVTSGPYETWSGGRWSPLDATSWDEARAVMFDKQLRAPSQVPLP
ncbi:MAG TPA: hypothetical protein VLC09_03750 [Polyangiaceae bacterium]|nr:hypothetical protein [Polyangiaceae bacterium]